MRFQNPHAGFPAGGMHGHQQQPQQFPQQAMMMQSGMMAPPQGMVYVQTPNGVVMMSAQQAMMMQQPMQQPMAQYPQQFPQRGMQQYPPQQPQQPVMVQQHLTDRFTQGEDSRFSSGQEQTRFAQGQQTQPQPQSAVEDTTPKSFTVTQTTHGFSCNDKLRLQVVTAGIPETSVKFIEDVVASDCEAGVIEYLIETVHGDELHKPLTASNLITNTTVYGVDFSEELRDLFSDGVRSLYKAAKSLFAGMTMSRQHFAIYVHLDDLLTKLVNDYLLANATIDVNIDSFFDDFNDLMKVVRNNEEDLEDRMLAYLDTRLDAIRQALHTHEPTTNTTVIPEVTLYAYLDKLVWETGLEQIDACVYLSKSDANLFLRTMTQAIVSKTGKREFVLVTADRSIYKFMVAENDSKIYVRQGN